MKERKKERKKELIVINRSVISVSGFGFTNDCAIKLRGKTKFKNGTEKFIEIELTE